MSDVQFGVKYGVERFDVKWKQLQFACLTGDPMVTNTQRQSKARLSACVLYYRKFKKNWIIVIMYFISVSSGLSVKGKHSRQ